MTDKTSPPKTLIDVLWKLASTDDHWSVRLSFAVALLSCLVACVALAGGLAAPLLPHLLGLFRGR